MKNPAIPESEYLLVIEGGEVVLTDEQLDQVIAATMNPLADLPLPSGVRITAGTAPPAPPRRTPPESPSSEPR